MYQEITKKVNSEFEEIVSRLEAEFRQIRSGRADPSLFNDIKVNCFGQEFFLKELAMVSLQSQREIIIQPWDESYIEPILGALQKISFGTNAIAEKNLIRISLPSLTEESRKEFIKLLSEKQEEQRVGIRRIRERAWKEVQDGEKQGLIREDDKFRGRDELDKLVKKYNEKIEEIGERKKKEIME